MKIEKKVLPLAKLELNNGQIEGLPANPREWTLTDVERLAASLKETPELLEMRCPIVVPFGNAFVTLGGNLRLAAARVNKAAEMPCFVLEGASIAKMREIVIKDNGSFGKWDFDSLANEWTDLPLTDWGVDVWEPEKEYEQPDEEKDGYTLGDDYAEPLRDRFIVPPFSVLNAQAGDWKERKNGWLERIKGLSVSREGTLSSGGLMEAINEGTSNFDPVLAEVMLKWFCPPAGRVLDPFAGEPVKGYVAGATGRSYTGVDIRLEQVEHNRKACAEFKGVEFYAGDSADLVKVLPAEQSYDFCITSPPYYDLEIYNGGEKDGSMKQTYQEFLDFMQKVWEGCYNRLAADTFFVVKVGEIRDKKGVYYNFVGDTISQLKKCGLLYYNELILVNCVGTAAVRANRNMCSRKVVKLHQNILVFVKGDITAAVAKLENLKIENRFRGFTADMEKIYNAVAAKERPKTVEGVDGALAGYLDAVGGIKIAEATDAPYMDTALQASRAVLLAYTGGKDSTTAALLLREQGWEVYPVFINGLNRSFPQERQAAEDICKMLGFPFSEITYKPAVKNEHPDNPVKNQLILALLADKAIAAGVGNISMGVIGVEDANYEYDWSDSRALMESYSDYLASTVQGLRYVDALAGRTEADNLHYILSRPDAAALWAKISSCVGPLRYRQNWRKQIQDKYGVALPENMCGRCYKCAFAYIMQAVTTGEYNREYLSYCFGVLLKKSTMMHQQAQGDGADTFNTLFGNYGQAVYDMYRSL